MTDMNMANQSTLSKQGFGLIIGLSIQFLLGMIIAMYVQFPETGSSKVMWEFTKTQPLVILHILLGTLLFLGSISFAVRSYKAKNNVWIKSSLVGLLTILGAWLSGEEFISRQNDALSLSMAVFFILAILSYVWGLKQSREN